jgi:DNA-binding transcriptional MerR regulator
MSEGLKALMEFQGIPKTEFPKILLYMDQLLGFFEEHLGVFCRSQRDSVLTKTMVNNYVKAKLLPPPKNKKYSRDQLMQLMLICHLKNVLSIDDLRRLTGAGKAGEWADDVGETFDIYTSAEQQALESLRLRLASLDMADPKAMAAEALRLAAEANILKQASERLLGE